MQRRFISAGLTLRRLHDITGQTNSDRDGAPANTTPRRHVAHVRRFAGIRLRALATLVMTTRYFAADPSELRLSVSAVVRRAERGHEILLMKRSDNAHWGLPGGYVEPGESVVAATQREVREETGFEIALGRLVGVYSDPHTQVIEYDGSARVHAVNLCFDAVAGASGEPTTPDEVLEVGFFGTDTLPQPFVPIHEIRVVDAMSGEASARVR